MRRSACLLVILPLLLLALTTSPVIASTDTRTAYFGVAVCGHGLVFCSHVNEQNPYYVGSAFGTLSFVGKASVTEIQYTLPGEWYQVVPGTLKAYGCVSVVWSKEGVNYAIQVRIYPITTNIPELLEPNQDVLLFTSGLQPQVLGCTGVYKAGFKTTSIQGRCGLYVIPGSILGLPTDAHLAFWLLQFMIDDTSIALAWADKPLTATIPMEDGSVTVVSFPAAMLKHEVAVL